MSKPLSQGVLVPTFDDLPEAYDDTELLDKLETLNKRVTAIETALNELSNNVPSPPGKEPPPEPPVDPLPEDSQILPITLPHGEQWTGLTNPPPTTFRTDHPRMLVTPESLPALREKLADPLYAKDVEAVQSSDNPSDWALCYLIWGDEEKGRSAIPRLIEWSFPQWHMSEDHGKMLQGVLMYDWLHNLMTEAQRREATETLRDKLPSPTQSTRQFHTSYMVNGAVPAFMASLALDDEVAQRERERLLDPEYKGLKLYRGLLDTLTINALQNGGSWHAGGHEQILHGYEDSFAIHGSPFALKSWQTATGQNPFVQTTYYERIPFDILCARRGIQKNPGYQGKTCLEYITGMGVSDESKGLAAWLLTQPGFTRLSNESAARQYRMILGDIRTKPLSPQEIGVPLWGYQDGGNAVYVRSGWGDEEFKCLFFARAWDRGRYEQFTSALVIHKGSKKPLPLNTDWKRIAADGFTGLRITEPGSGIRHREPYGSSREARYPEEVVHPDRTWHRPETLTHLSESNGIITATARFEHLVPVDSPPKICQRTVQVDPQAETVQVNDYVVGLLEQHNCLITYGLSEAPEINGNVIENSDVRITVQTEFEEIWWDEKEAEKDRRGSQWIVGTLKIRPAVVEGTVNAQTLVEVK